MVVIYQLKEDILGKNLITSFQKVDGEIKVNNVHFNRKHIQYFEKVIYLLPFLNVEKLFKNMDLLKKNIVLV